MKLADLRVGSEYAIHRYGTEASVRYNVPVRAEMVGIVEVPGAGRKARIQRLAQFRLLEDADWGGFEGKAVKGSMLQVRPQMVWWPWGEEVARRQALQEEREGREANAAAAREALAWLGLHDVRRMETDSDPHRFNVTLSLFELHKLYERARHLVELERLVYEFRREVKPRGWISEQVYTWAADHDFSMLLSEQPPSQP